MKRQKATPSALFHAAAHVRKAKTAPLHHAAARAWSLETFYPTLPHTSAIYTILCFTPGAPDLAFLGALLTAWDMTTANNPATTNGTLRLECPARR